MIDDKPDEQEQQRPIVPLISKQFVLKHTFEDIMNWRKNTKWSDSENYFGFEWYIYINQKDDALAIYLVCDRLSDIENWSIQTDFEFNIIGPNDNVFSKSTAYTFEEIIENGIPSFMKMDELKKDYLVNDELKVEAHVKILKMSGVYKDDLRRFDDSECSDIVLIVNEKKFYVSKLTLAAHSPYFKAMFLGMFGESKKSEIKLSGVDADDFQKYLEVVYGESAIDEFTVEGILLVADMYDTPIVIRKCEEYLLKGSEKELKKKLEFSVRYHLLNLKKKCLDEVKTVDDIRSVLPSNIRDMDPSIVADLLEKCLTFN